MNVKPGDLAIVVWDDIAENIGRIVLVEGPAELDGSEGPGFWWDVIAKGQPVAYNYHGSTPGSINGYSLEAEILDSNLRPVSGLPITDDVSNEVTA